mgnify:CR=1 FL=1
MAYVPWQQFDKICDNLEEGFRIGTIFPELSKGSKNKYELDKETGFLILDRILHTSTHYPANYGFIPRTYGDDKSISQILLFIIL